MQIFILLSALAITIIVTTRSILDPNGYCFYRYKTYPKPIFLNMQESEPGTIRYIKQPEKKQFRVNLKTGLAEILLDKDGSKIFKWTPLSDVRMGYKKTDSVDLMPGLPEGLYINDYYSSDFR